MTLCAVCLFAGVQAQTVQAGSPATDGSAVQPRQHFRMEMVKRMPQQAQCPQKGVYAQKKRCPMDVLQLTEDQKNQIKAIRLESGKKMVPVKAQLGVKRAELKALQVAEKADTKAINAKVDEVAKLQAELMKIGIDGKMKTRALLNDEQKLKFDAMGAHRKPARAQHRRPMR